MEKKFRVWLNKKMIYIKDDIYISFFNAKGAVDWSICNRKDQTTIYKHDISYPEIYNNSKLMQYTGINNNKGVNIFGSDIVHVAGIGNCIVKFDNTWMCWMFIEIKGEKREFDYQSIVTYLKEIKGNIYQNKELL